MDTKRRIRAPTPLEYLRSLPGKRDAEIDPKKRPRSFRSVCSAVVGIEFLEDFHPRLFDIDIQTGEYPGGHAIAFTEQPQQKMFGADVSVVQGLGFFGRKGQYHFYPRCVRDVADCLLGGAGADAFLDLPPDDIKIKSELLEHIDRDAITQADHAAQQVLGSDEIVVEADGFSARQVQSLLCPW